MPSGNANFLNWSLTCPNRIDNINICSTYVTPSHRCSHEAVLQSHAELRAYPTFPSPLLPSQQTVRFVFLSTSSSCRMRKASSKVSPSLVPSRPFPTAKALLDLSDHDWHRISIKKALRLLDVAPKAGLHATEAQRRAAQYGANRISPPPIRMLPKVVGWVFGGFGSLLLAASIFCFIAWYASPLPYSTHRLSWVPNAHVNLVYRKPLGNPNPQGSNLALAVILFVFVIFQVVLNAWQECTTSRIMASDLLLDDVIVVRDGVHTSLPATSLVPGDIVRIVEGQKVPADMKLIEVRDGLRFDRSMLTGEVCVKTRLRMHDRNHVFPTLSRSRVNLSPDTWESQMTTSSR